MAYEKQTFVDNETVLTAGHLNHIEDGIEAVEKQIAEAKAYTHAIPTSLSMANAIKRARQLTDVEWTPKGTIPGTIKVDGEPTRYEFVEGQTYKGVPYEGGAISTYTYVGLNVDLDTFFSAVQNPNSILYTHDNEKYNDTGAGYYGTVCSKFAQYALNIPSNFNTANIPNIEGMETIAAKGKYNEYDVKLCDVMVDTSSHTVIVTDILYDSFGRVAYIEISEAVRPLCRRLLWTPDEFNAKWVPDYRLCRYSHINDIPYTKREYVNIESENAEIPVPDPALMPQYGDKKNNKLKSGGTMPVHILKEGYTKAVVLRDGVVISEVDITNATEFSYDLGTAGYIEMYLEDDAGNKSESRYACVVSATLEVTESSEYYSGKLGVHYTGTSGKPAYIQMNANQTEFCRLDGLGRSTITDENNAVLSFDVSRASKSIRVAYQNEYGTYYSDYVSFTVEEKGASENTSTDAYLSLGLYYDGYALTEDAEVPVINEETAGYRTWTSVPVEANTTYLVEGAERVWFFDRSRNPISTIAVDGQFTTPDLTAFMSVSFVGTEQGTEAVERIGATNAITDQLVSETGATLLDNKQMNASSYTSRISNEDYFSYLEIPVEAGATYYTRGGVRAWFLDSEKAALTTSNKTTNIATKATSFTFTVPSGAAYLSLDYNKTNGNVADMVRIRKLS